jgi:hypothetical protein
MLNGKPDFNQFDREPDGRIGGAPYRECSKCNQAMIAPDVFVCPACKTILPRRHTPSREEMIATRNAIRDSWSEHEERSRRNQHSTDSFCIPDYAGTKHYIH